ncbi:hypothetical protein ABDK56_08340 [Sphingomonas sp. ASV193]|uniref:hypothetical protein n=1 Tax=Sphingomonas sp. ASV193 TaxID=3144405 RepID=UPI0032E8D223
MLSDAEIQRLHLIRDAAEKNYRSASYDLRIGELIDPQGNVVESYELPAQGIVEVISQEEVSLPATVIGIAMVKTRLCQEGILALSIGIIDPGFEGKISSFLINFGKEVRLLQKGEIFLRTTYQKLDGEPSNPTPVKLDYDEMMRERKRASVEKFEATFLSIDTVASKSAGKVFKDYKNAVLAYVGGAALVLAVLTFLLNFATMWVKWPATPPAVSNAGPTESVEVGRLIDQNEELNRRLTLIERSLPPVENGKKKTAEQRR